MKRIVMAGMLLLASVPVGALEVAGVKLNDNVRVGTQSLVLNGAGIRTRFLLNIYVGALYLPRKQTSAEAIIDDDAERRIVLSMLREMSSAKLYGALREAVEANHAQDVLSAIDGQMKQMKQIFESVGAVRKGDVITIDYLPAAGTQVSVNGTVRGTITGAGFGRALLRIWLGNNPVQEELKKGMLGA